MRHSTALNLCETCCVANRYICPCQLSFVQGKIHQPKTSKRRQTAPTAALEAPTEDPLLSLPPSQSFVNVAPETTMTYRVVCQQQAVQFSGAAADLERRKAVNPLAAAGTGDERGGAGIIHTPRPSFSLFGTAGSVSLIGQSRSIAGAGHCAIHARRVLACWILFPGQPHTQWPKPEPGGRPAGGALNNQVLSEAVCSLLPHLETPAKRPTRRGGRPWRVRPV